MSQEKHPTIDLDCFISYKKCNYDMLPALVGICNINKHNKQTRPNGNNWKKLESKTPDNWLLTSKLNQTDDDKLFSQIRSILNKLSDTNFNDLAKELMSLEMTTYEHLTKLTELLFNKALIEPKFSNMYAKLAKELYNYTVKENDTIFYFRESLINRCQKTFTTCISVEDQSNLITKETSTGCMTFIGELYLYDLLTNKIINSCFLLLLSKINSNKSHMAGCICSLMKVVKIKFKTNCSNESDVINKKIADLIATNTLQNKEKFRLMDIIGL